MYWEVIQYKNTGKETQNEQIMNTEGNMRSLRHCVVHKLQQEEAPAEPGKKKKMATTQIVPEYRNKIGKKMVF